MTKWTLFTSMVLQQEIRYAGYVGVPMSIEMEDGSGCCFNVQLRLGTGKCVTIFIRTED